MDGALVQKKYKITKILGKGKFGTVYQGQNVKTNELVAIKQEIHNIRDINIIKNEATILNYLYRNGCKFIPFVYWYGLFLENPTLVMSHYEMSLNEYTMNLYKFGANKVDSIEIEDTNMNNAILRWFKNMLNILENIHSNFIIHRDIKPQNFMIRDGEIYLIDFGMATTFVDNTNNHVEEKTAKNEIIGTPKYISHNIHNGIEPSRRDDVISACYIYLYMKLGNLPWDQEKCPRYIRLDSDCKYENEIYNELNKWRAFLKSWEYLEKIAVSIGNPFYSFIKSLYLKEFKDKPNYVLDSTRV
jgi:casein kinase 1